MSAESSEMYQILIQMQQTIHDNHRETSEQVENVKQLFLDKLEPVESMVQKHDNAFQLVGKVFTYLIPSGVIVSILGWIAALQHK